MQRDSWSARGTNPILTANTLLSLRGGPSDALLAAVAYMLEGQHHEARGLIDAKLLRCEASAGCDGLRLTAGLLAELAADVEEALASYQMVSNSERHQYRISALLALAFLHARTGAKGLANILLRISREDSTLVRSLAESVVATRSRREGQASLGNQIAHITQVARDHRIDSLEPLLIHD